VCKSRSGGAYALSPDPRFDKLDQKGSDLKYVHDAGAIGSYFFSLSSLQNIWHQEPLRVRQRANSAAAVEDGEGPASPTSPVRGSQFVFTYEISDALLLVKDVRCLMVDGRDQFAPVLHAHGAGGDTAEDAVAKVFRAAQRIIEKAKSKTGKGEGKEGKDASEFQFELPPLLTYAGEASSLKDIAAFADEAVKSARAQGRPAAAHGKSLTLAVS